MKNPKIPYYLIIVVLTLAPFALVSDLHFLESFKFGILAFLCAYLVFIYFSSRPGFNAPDLFYFLCIAISLASLARAFSSLDVVADNSQLTKEVGFALLSSVIGIIGRAVVIARHERSDPDKEDQDPFAAVRESANVTATTLTRTANEFAATMTQTGKVATETLDQIGKDYAAASTGVQQTAKQVNDGAKVAAKGAANLASGMGDLTTSLAQAGERLNQMRAPGGVSADELNSVLNELHSVVAALNKQLELAQRRPVAAPFQPRRPSFEERVRATAPEPPRRSFWSLLRQLFGGAA